MSYTLSRSDLISDVSKNSSRALELLSEYGLSCATCFLNSFDSVESGAAIHGMSDEEINTMVNEINEVLAKEFN